jgi:hypothetical protein
MTILEWALLVGAQRIFPAKTSGDVSALYVDHSRGGLVCPVPSEYQQEFAKALA